MRIVVAAPARAERPLSVVAGPTLGGSTGNGWSGDGVIPGAQLRAGYRFANLVGPVFVGREAYAKEDERLLTLISLGAQVWWPPIEPRPYARLSWVHQHEEFVGYAQDEPFGVLFGVGNGIRHRGGVELALGTDIRFAESESIDWLLSPELYADWILASEAPGPKYYLGGGLSVGLAFAP